ncbi:MAG TPA: ClpXP protease specificity-enhancing factor [Wenzhouxiangellaceae bacterium]|nr:ClpXP protease specificity-enhancing factor [Wenzhouxiangellaceae bacterium]
MSDSPAKMTSSQPYLLRALNEWIVDNGFTPQILVDSTHPDLNIPDAVRAGDKVVLNISPGAVRDLELDNEYLSFVARFSGVSHAVLVPIEAVQAIYARENGQGMMFPEADQEDAEQSAEPGDSDSRTDNKKSGPKRGKPNLKVIK